MNAQPILTCSQFTKHRLTSCGMIDNPYDDQFPFMVVGSGTNVLNHIAIYACQRVNTTTNEQLSSNAMTDDAEGTSITQESMIPNLSHGVSSPTQPSHHHHQSKNHHQKQPMAIQSIDMKKSIPMDAPVVALAVSKTHIVAGLDNGKVIRIGYSIKEGGLIRMDAQPEVVTQFHVPVSCVCMNEHLLVAGSEDGMLTMFHVSTKDKTTIKGDAFPITAIHLSGHRFYTASQLSIKLWDTNYKVIKSIRLPTTSSHEKITALEVVPSRPIVLAGTSEGNVYIWDNRKTRTIQQIVLKSSPVWAIGLLSSLELVLFAQENGNVHLTQFEQKGNNLKQPNLIDPYVAGGINAMSVSRVNNTHHDFQLIYVTDHGRIHYQQYS